MQYMQLAMMLLGEQQAKQLSQEQLDLLAKQYSNISGIPLPQLAQITPDQLGPSAMGSMAPDEALRGKQLAALGEVQNVIDQGGLNLGDKAGLEEAINSAVSQQRRARAGVASDAAERGQLNSGNRLMMDMNAAQAGSNAQRQTDLGIAAQAQQRRLQAIQDSASMAANLRNEDWAQKSDAAKAKDLRDERNAAAREKAQYYNAGLPQQNFTNAMAKATGSQPAANAYGGGLGAAAADTRAATAGMVGIAGAAGNNTPTGGGGGGGDPYQYTSDVQGGRGGPADLTGGNTDTEDPEWKNPYA